MKLTYFQGDVPNFGDELNLYLWDRLLPAGFLDEDDGELFLGIGSILWDHLPAAPRKVVVGSGYGGYTGLPNVHDGSWDIAFVRGPLTASLLGLPREKAICDAAVLLRAIALPKPAQGMGICYMPHFESLERGDWAGVCAIAGIRLIDPTDPVETVLAQIAGAELVITEAMHGAIVADALRVPWIAVTPVRAENRMKWLDWSGSLGIDLRQHPLLPSSLLELYMLRTQHKYYGGRAKRISDSRFAAPINRALMHRAARNLAALAQQRPQLSSDDAIAGVTGRALAAVEGVVKKGRFQQLRRAV